MSFKNIINDQAKVTQAVVFAESFDQRFGPLTHTTPKVLIPLVNRPLLDYTIEMLANSGIQETFIFCNQNSTPFRGFINDWRDKLKNKMSIQAYFSEEYTNIGAAIRDIDAKALVKSNFVLLHGDCIGNVNLKELIEIHKQNTQRDPGCVMTSVYRRVNPNHRLRTHENDTVLMLDSRKKIIFSDKILNKKSVDLPMELINNDAVNVHYDLYDTHVSICSDKVPPDFVDNFDWESKEDFLKGLLADDELLQHYVYAHLLEDCYLSRVTNVREYFCVSNDMIRRYIFPIVPDGERNCSYRRNNIYLQDKVNLMNNIELVQDVAIERETEIGSNSRIESSSIGINCRIGKNVIIEGSCIWNNVIIEDDCRITNSLIASNVIIRSKTIVGKNCVICNNVVLDVNTTLNSNECVHYDMNDKQVDHGLAGPKGRGVSYTLDIDEDNLDDAFDLWGSPLKLIEHDNQSFSTSFSDSSNEESDDDFNSHEYKNFFNEVYESLQRGIEKRFDAENLILEINSSKHAYNVPMKEVNSLLIKALLKLAEEKGEFHKTIREYLDHMLPMIKNYIRSIDSQRDCIYAIEEFFLLNNNYKPVILTKIIDYLYDKNILEEDLIISWYKQPQSLPDHEIKEQTNLRAQKEIKLFIKWLEEAEEEDDDETSDED